MAKEIPIFFSSDNNYVPYMTVSIVSLMKNASKNYDYNIIILYNNLTEENLKILQSLAHDNFKVTTVSMDKKKDELTKTSTDNLCTDYYSLSIYFRIFIPAMFPEYDKGIYLDSDLVVTGDISKLYEMDLQNKAIGGLIDQSIQHVPEFINYVEKALGIEKTKYINSGVLLLDMKKLRQLNFGEKFLDVLNKYHFETVAPDQDYINVICKNQIQLLPTQWNAMSSDMIYDIKDPQILHFNLFGKPWRYDNIPYAEVFWEYAKLSPYYEAIVEGKKNYPDKKRETAKRYLKHMLEKSVEICTKEKTFSNIFDKGIETRL